MYNPTVYLFTLGLVYLINLWHITITCISGGFQAGVCWALSDIPIYVTKLMQVIFILIYTILLFTVYTIKLCSFLEMLLSVIVLYALRIILTCLK